MKQRFCVDFSFGSKKFEALQSYSSTGYTVSSKKFSVKFDRRSALARMRSVMECVLDTPASVAVRFCGVEEMREMNLRFRGKNKPTDVLSFGRADFLMHEQVRELGDIVICLPVCMVQARRARIALACEVERMLVHGLTHLLGFDHERSKHAWKVQSALEKSLRLQVLDPQGKPTWCELRN